MATSRVEKPRPTKASAQNGTTSRQKWLRPRLPQTHARLSTYDGMEPMATAVMLEAMGPQPSRPLVVSSTSWLTTTATAETMA
jgi:hypothetical protein